jgi:hypothetical protein
MENRSAARVQPDISIICDPSKLTERGCNGSLEMVVEITSPSNASRDYITKADLYKMAKVNVWTELYSPEKPPAPLRDGGARGMETGRFSRRHNKPTLKTAIWM